MKVADLGVDPRIAAILKEQGIEDFYPPQERAAPIALAGEIPSSQTSRTYVGTCISFRVRWMAARARVPTAWKGTLS